MSDKGEDIIEQLWGENLDRVKGKVLKKVSKGKEERQRRKVEKYGSNRRRIRKGERVNR